MIPPNHILIIRFSSLGDIILLTPLFREVHRLFPNAEIDFLTSTTFAGICANNPHINQVIAIDRKGGSEPLKQFMVNHPPDTYDLVIDAHRSLRSRLLLLKWLGILNRFQQKTVSINKRSFKRNLLLSTGINLMKGAVSQRKAYLNLIRHLDKKDDPDTRTELFPSSTDIKRAQKIIQENRLEGQKIVALGPGASFPGKCWSKESFLALCTSLQKEGYPVVLLGGKGEEEPVWIENNSDKKLLNLAGELSYLETAAILDHCALVISNDSAVVHFAEAMQVPAIAIFGPTTREFGYGPFLPKSRIMEVDLKCRPCSRNGKGKCSNTIQRQCLVDISVQSVLEAALHTLGL